MHACKCQPIVNQTRKLTYYVFVRVHAHEQTRINIRDGRAGFPAILIT